MACDVVFAGKAACFGDQHAQYGCTPAGVARSVCRVWSACAGRSIRRIPAPRPSRRWGLANAVFEDAELQDKAMAYAVQLAKRNPQGIALMKSLSRQGLDGTGEI